MAPATSVINNTLSERYSFQTFFEKFAEICSEHQSSSKAFSFAFILYDFKDANISKVLQDVTYWRSLDAITANYLSVFSIHYKEKVRYRKRPGNQNPHFNRMIDISHFENPSDGAMDLIEKYFDIGLDVKFPALLLFQTKSGQVINYTVIQLNGNSIEDSFDELKTYLEGIVAVSKKIDEENRNNVNEIFEIVKMEAERIKGLKNAINVFKTIAPLHKFLSIVAGFHNGK